FQSLSPPRLCSILVSFVFFSLLRAPPCSSLFPYTTLFRSLLLMPTLNFLPVWFALSLLRFRLPSRLPMMFILWMEPKKTQSEPRSEERFSRNAETELVCRLLLEKTTNHTNRPTHTTSPSAT